jgi:hypothetical protein
MTQSQRRFTDVSLLSDSDTPHESMERGHSFHPPSHPESCVRLQRRRMTDITLLSTDESPFEPNSERMTSHDTAKATNSNSKCLSPTGLSQVYSPKNLHQGEGATDFSLLSNLEDSDSATENITTSGSERSGHPERQQSTASDYQPSSQVSADLVPSLNEHSDVNLDDSIDSITPIESHRKEYSKLVHRKPSLLLFL